jgi:hypothetical protein
MRYTVDMALDDMIYLPRFTKIGSGIQKLIGRDTDTHTRRQEGDFIHLFYFFKIREVG